MVRHAACIYRNRAGPGYCPPQIYDYNECDCATGGGVNACTRIECFPTSADCVNKNMTVGEHGYARTRVENVGALGKGLFARQTISLGDYIIEYVGEIIGRSEHEKRQRVYQRHLYSLEFRDQCVIDASFHGNDARYINHSCNPNAEMQKWNARGVECIGIFAIRTIQCGEEITFDYRMREQDKKCLCGEHNCKGYM